MPAAPQHLRGASSYLRALSWAGVGWIVVFWRLGYPTLMDPDEAHYAELTREMLRAKSWLVPLLDGRPFIDKPILFHWLQGAAMWVLGETEFAVRLPTALAALGLFWLTRRAGRLVFGDVTGEWGALMFATIPATFALASLALFDMMFAALLFGAITCFIEASRGSRPRAEIAGYALLALAAMLKGPVALLLAALFCAGAWAAGGELRARVGRLRWKTGLAGAAIAASPWFIYMFVRFGNAFVRGYLLAGNLYYFTQPEDWSSRAIDHFFYLRSFAGGFFPWSLVASARLVELARRRQEADVEERLLWIWTAVVIAFFSLARFKLDTYIFPAAPGVCLLAAKAWRDAYAGEGAAGRTVRTVVLALGGAFVVAGSFISVYLFELNLDLPTTAVVLPLVLGSGGIAMLAVSAWRHWRLPATPLVPVLTLLAIYAVIVGVGLPALEKTRPTALVARALKDHSPHDAATAIYQLEQWRASLRYYAERPLAALATPAEAAAFLEGPSPRYIIIRRRDFHALRAADLPVHDLFHRHAVTGTHRYRAGLRRQLWSELIIVTNAPPERRGRWLP